MNIIPEGQPARPLTAAAMTTRAAELSRYHDALEHAGRRSAAAFDGLFATPPPGISVHEILPDKTFTRVSPGHTKLLGYEPRQLVGKPASHFVILQGTSELAIARKLSPTALLLPFTRTWRKADGTEVTLVMVDRHIKDETGHIVGIRTVVGLMA